MANLDAARKANKNADRVLAAMLTARSVLGIDSVKDIIHGKVAPRDTQLVLELNKKLSPKAASKDGFFGPRIPAHSSAPSGPDVTYIVRQISKTSIEYIPDGTNAKPYRSILDAFNAAKAVDSRLVELVVDGGYYNEPLSIDRNTILRAARGSRPIIASNVFCTRAVQLEITGFSLFGAPSPGALQVIVPGSSVTLIDVEIRGAQRYGILQRGGEIELRSVTIRDTRREAGQMEYGAGLVIKDGTQAFLSNVTLNNNESSGIIVRGEGTYLNGADIVLRGNKLHPDYYAEAVSNLGLPIGAFLIYDRAQASLINLQMYENEPIGLGVYGGAESNVDNAIINLNRSIRTLNEDGTMKNYWGIGIRARDGGHITMQNFLISQCDLSGVAVHPRGEIDLQVGDICRNVIGVHLAGDLGETYAIERLMDRVRYFDNEMNLDSETLPLPRAGTGVPD